MRSIPLPYPYPKTFAKSFDDSCQLNLATQGWIKVLFFLEIRVSGCPGKRNDIPDVAHGGNELNDPFQP